MQNAAINFKQAKDNRLPDLTANLNHGLNQGRSIDPFTNSYVSQNIGYGNYNLSSGITLLAEYIRGGFYWEHWMQNFMASFFLVFSFFKLLNIQGFADSYSTYDIIAKKWKGWGLVYAFIELSLGISYLLKFNPLAINAITSIVITVSIIGVLQSVLNKRKIKCACLGSVLNLPMSTITILEDALMISMSAAMMISLL